MRHLSCLILAVLVCAAGARAAEFSPRAVLSGTENVKVTLRGCPAPVKVTAADGAEIPAVIRPGRPGGAHTVILARTPDADTVIRFHFAKTETEPLFLPVIKQFRIALSFDDGPAQGKTEEFKDSPTYKVLEALSAFRHGEGHARQGIAAVFFLLTSPDSFLYDGFTKGETAFGAAMIQETFRRGHLLGVHWGGGYAHQTDTHPGHVREPGTHGGQENRLEAELQQCAERITELTNVRPEFVRPTLWVYRDKRHPEVSALPTYRRLGLKMILTDGKYPDGGYKIISMFCPAKSRLFARNLEKAFRSGERYLVFSMHDSNIQTAEALPEILAMIEKVFNGIDFGTGRANRDGAARLRFATTADEVRAVLNAKKRFVMFPAEDY